LIKVSACGVCRTDLHIIDGELASPSLPLIPGHQIVGSVEKTGADVTTFNPGDGMQSGLSK
jgi:alcohol dehydrogenase, propanol-preferring